MAIELRKPDSEIRVSLEEFDPSGEAKAVLRQPDVEEGREIIKRAMDADAKPENFFRSARRILGIALLRLEKVEIEGELVEVEREGRDLTRATMDLVFPLAGGLVPKVVELCNLPQADRKNS